MGGEYDLTLEEILEDPMVILHMSSYGLQADDVRLVMREADARQADNEVFVLSAAAEAVGFPAAF